LRGNTAIIQRNGTQKSNPRNGLLEIPLRGGFVRQGVVEKKWEEAKAIKSRGIEGSRTNQKGGRGKELRIAFQGYHGPDSR